VWIETRIIIQKKGEKEDTNVHSSHRTIDNTCFPCKAFDSGGLVADFRIARETEGKQGRNGTTVTVQSSVETMEREKADTAVVSCGDPAAVWI